MNETVDFIFLINGILTMLVLTSALIGGAFCFYVYVWKSRKTDWGGDFWLTRIEKRIQNQLDEIKALLQDENNH